MSIRNATIIWQDAKLRLVNVEFSVIDTARLHKYVALEELATNALNEKSWQTIACYEPDAIPDDRMKKLIQCLLQGTSRSDGPSVSRPYAPSGADSGDVRCD